MGRMKGGGIEERIERGRLLDTGYRIQVTGYRLQDTGYRGCC